MAINPQIKDVRTNKIIHVEKGKSVYDAAQTMSENNISSVIILDKNAVAGIVTEKDMVTKVICLELDPKQTRVEHIMSTPVHTIDATQTIVEAARMMRELKIKKLVVTEGKEVKGIISERDILEIDPALHSQTLKD